MPIQVSHGPGSMRPFFPTPTIGTGSIRDIDSIGGVNIPAVEREEETLGTYESYCTVVETRTRRKFSHEHRKLGVEGRHLTLLLECRRAVRRCCRVLRKIILRNDDVTLAFDPDRPEGSGTLTVTNTRVVWLSSDDRSKAFDFDVAYICLHAISNDASTYPTPCIYCQLAVEEEDVLKEAFFSPRDREGATLQALFEAFSTAAEMNPGFGEDEEEPQGEGELVFDHGSALTSDQERVLAHLDSVLVVPEGLEPHDDQFEDAEAEEAEEDQEGVLEQGVNGENGHANGALPHPPSS